MNRRPRRTAAEFKRIEAQIEALAGKVPVSEIAASVGETEAYVRAVANRTGMKLTTDGARMSDEDAPLIRALYADGMPLIELVQKFGYSQYLINKTCEDITQSREARKRHREHVKAAKARAYDQMMALRQVGEILSRRDAA